MIKSYLSVFLFMLCMAAFSNSAAATRLDLLKVPAGFKIELFADNLPNARTMVLGDKGTVFVGTRGAGNVYAIINGKKYTIASGLNMPNGLAYHKKSLYIAAVDKLYRIDNIEANLSNPKLILVSDIFPRESHHGWRYIDFGPDGRLYMAIGAPCNVCLQEDYAQIRSMKADGTDQQVVAKGIRNSVGFSWHPQNNKLWLSNNGRDLLGDDIPPDELIRVDKKGQHFGFPYCHAGMVPDPDYGDFSCDTFSHPAKQLGAHVAPLGITFYTGNMFPQTYKNQLFVAEHGSWNRSKKVGYRVAVATLDGDKVTDYQTFVSGWLQGENAWGRPAYILQLKDGSILISDDKAGVIYRVSYSK
jgi:glucose/arabinose dehydrogenase